MPNFDAGTYFLTTLAPVRHGETELRGGGVGSWEQRLRVELARLPTALQSPATEQSGVNSPFSRNRRNHLCRFAVIDDVVYNGRPKGDPILRSIRQQDPIDPDPVDGLSCAFLMFAADVDAVTEEAGGPLPATLDKAAQDRVRDAYARRLWETMETELRDIYGCCVGFEEVNSADAFAAYIAKAQVETTMPFHDYWVAGDVTDPPALLPKLGKVLAGAADVFALALVAALFGASWLWPLGGLAVLAGAVWWAYGRIMGVGAEPLPPPSMGDLPTVLKSVYLQQKFSDFSAGTQTLSDQALFDAFGEFLATHRPQDVDGPTQAPGTVYADAAAKADAKRTMA